MKKFFVLLLMFLFAMSLAACTEEGEPKDPATLIIQFVPSTSVDSAMLTKLKNLETLLKTELAELGYDINVNISISTSYASVIEAMDSGQVHVAFLTAQQYAFTTVEYPGKVTVLLTSVREAYNAQIDDLGNIITDPALIIANANEDPDYDASTTPDVKVSSYYAMLLVRDEDLAEYEEHGIAALAGKNVGTQTVTSGSGFVYPSFLLYQNDLTFVSSSTPNAAAGEVQYTVISGHQNAVLSLLNNDVDAVFTFFDSRNHATAYNSWLAANPGKTVFGETKVAALTTGIYNDTISAILTLSPGLREAIQEAFMNVIKIPEGYQALQIYNHSDYLIANDEDYEGERQFYIFLRDND